jgi:hypothetical protein
MERHMRGLKRKVFIPLAICASLVLISSLSACSAPMLKSQCKSLDEGISAFSGAAIDWPVGTPRYVGFGRFKCNTSITVKVKNLTDYISADPNYVPYSFGAIYLSLGNNQDGYGDSGDDIKNLLKDSNITKVTTISGPSEVIHKGSIFQVFETVRTEKLAKFYGVEKLSLEVDIFDISNKLIQTFKVTRDYGVQPFK